MSLQCLITVRASARGVALGAARGDRSGLKEGSGDAPGAGAVLGFKTPLPFLLRQVRNRRKCLGEGQPAPAP